MPHRVTPHPPHYDHATRQALLENDIYHLDARLNELTNAVEATSQRLHALSTRTQQAEYTLRDTVRGLETLQGHSAQLAEKMPDLEGMVRMLRWLLDALKYLAGLAILAGAIAGGQTMQALKAIFG